MDKKIEAELEVFDPIVAGLEQLKLEAVGFVVKDPTDKSGYDAVKQFRNQRVVKLKVAIEAERTRVKKFYLDAGREIDGRAKEIQAEIQKVIDYCRSQEAVVDDEIARVKAEAEEARRKVREERESKLVAVKAVLSSEILIGLGELSEERFGELLQQQTARFEAEERARLEKERELEELRQAHLEAIKKQEEDRKKYEAAQVALIEAQKRENAELKRKAEEEKEKARALREQQEAEARAAKAKQEQEDRQKAEAEAKAQKEIADKKMYAEIKQQFPTLESAWIEIARLRRNQKK